MPVEEIISELQKQDKIIDEAQKAKKALYAKLDQVADYDWITVRAAANILGVSDGTVYNKVNSGELSSRRIASSVRVRKSEVVKIDDTTRS